MKTKANTKAKAKTRTPRHYERGALKYESPVAMIVSDIEHDPHYKDGSMLRIINFKVTHFPHLSCMLAVRKPMRIGEVNARLLVIHHTSGITTSSRMLTIRLDYAEHLLDVRTFFLGEECSLLQFLYKTLILAQYIDDGNITIN